MLAASRTESFIVAFFERWTSKHRAFGRTTSADGLCATWLTRRHPSAAPRLHANEQHACRPQISALFARPCLDAPLWYADFRDGSGSHDRKRHPARPECRTNDNLT